MKGDVDSLEMSVHVIQDAGVLEISPGINLIGGWVNVTAQKDKVLSNVWVGLSPLPWTQNKTRLTEWKNVHMTHKSRLSQGVLFSRGGKLHFLVVMQTNRGRHRPISMKEKGASYDYFSHCSESPPQTFLLLLLVGSSSTYERRRP